MNCTRLAENTGLKNRHLGTIAQLCRVVSSQLRHLSTIGKNSLNTNTCSTCPNNMVNFGPLTAEIGSGVWGSPANFNGFLVLAALLHGTLVVGVSQTLRRWTEALPIFGRAAITLGIGPHSSSKCCLQSGATSYPVTPPTTTHSFAALRYSAGATDSPPTNGHYVYYICTLIYV